MIELVDINGLKPAPYNPRKADENRLSLVELSLKKLGFLIPVYAARDGDILSGNQRHGIASRIGAKYVPVDFCDDMDLKTRKAVNIVFNRGTNDFKKNDTPKSITEALQRYNVYDLAGKIKDKNIYSDEFFPCLRSVPVEVSRFLKPNSGRWNLYSRNMASTLRQYGIQIPVVATDDLMIINGIGRVQYAAERKNETIDTVFISKDEAEFATVMMNLLSMDFDIHTRYRDLLRYNAFRRFRLARKELGHGFVFMLERRCKDFNLFTPINKRRWIHVYGNSVVDFGAGHLIEAQMLRSIGVRVNAFEPYIVSGKDETIDKEKSINVSKEFLKDVAAGTKYTSVFLSSVLNSVPFHGDRQKIVCICAALCGADTTLYAAARGEDDPSWRDVNGACFLNIKSANYRAFKLDYEPGITIGDLANPKVQKFHTKNEFNELFRPYFESITVFTRGGSVFAICKNPKPLDRATLIQAIEFEFDLPYPDGTTMGMIDTAKKCFSLRLGVKM